MDFSKTLPQIVIEFKQADINFALIGGLAIAMHGLQRATLDADFLLLIEDLDKAEKILTEIGYTKEFHSENVSHFTSKDQTLGRVDILHAFRPVSQRMLKNCLLLPLSSSLSIPVLPSEDLIGLKIQAAHNQPSRYRADWNDIFSLIEHASSKQKAIDWAIISEYLEMFDQQSELKKLQEIYEAT